MLGTACFRLCIRGSQCPPTVALSHVYHCSPHPYPAQVTCRHATTISFSRSLSWTRQQTVANAGGCRLHVGSCVKRPCCHMCSCVEEGSEVRCATIWHGLLPSHHPSILDQNIISPSNNGHSFSSFDPHFGSSSGSTLSVSYEDHVGSHSSISGLGMLQVRSGRVKRTSGLSFPDASAISMGRFAMAAGLLDGSWNVAWDARPARWLHGRHSAWLLFGICACFSAAASVSVPNMPLPPSPLMHVEGVKEQSGSSGCGSDCEIVPAENVIEGKQVLTDYTVTGIPGDGRCLFRAIAYGLCLRNGDPASSESSQRELADELRDKVVDELVSRRADSEWFIEETFDSYVKRMRERHVWGGEPELLMASHVLKVPITVHLFDRSSGGLLSIAEYGLEYGSENPIRVLYHGFGHYDAVQVPGSGTHSKL